MLLLEKFFLKDERDVVLAVCLSDREEYLEGLVSLLREAKLILFTLIVDFLEEFIDCLIVKLILFQLK